LFKLVASSSKEAYEKEEWTLLNSKNFNLLTLEKIEKALFDEYHSGELNFFDSILRKRLLAFATIISPPERFSIDQSMLPFFKPTRWDEKQEIEEEVDDMDSSKKDEEPFDSSSLLPVDIDAAEGSTAIQICAAVFLPLIKNICSADPTLYASSLDALEKILEQASQFSLQSEPPILLSSLQEFLDSLLSFESKIDSLNKRKVLILPFIRFPISSFSFLSSLSDFLLPSSTSSFLVAGI